MAAHPEVRSLARRLDRLERSSRIRKQPGLAHSSIEDGALHAVLDGETVMVIGQQYDGTNAAAVVAGPTPPVPAGLSVTNETSGGLTVRWDGTFVDAVVAPMDFQRVTVHAIPTATWDGSLDPQTTDLALGSISSATGGQVWIPVTPEIDMTVILIAWSQAGKLSLPSLPETGAAVAPGLDTNAPEWIALMAQAEAAATAAEQAQQAAQAAAQVANDAAQAADAAGTVASEAQSAASAATDAANDAVLAAATAQAAADANPTDADLQAVADAAAQAAAAAQSTATDAAQAAATAQSAAVSAASAASAAGVAATNAQTTADGKNTVRYATFAPTNEANRVGDTWFVRRAAATANEPIGTVIAQYEGAGSNAWTQRPISSAVFASIDAGKITFGTMSGERIQVGSLVIGQVGGLQTSLDSKETPAGAAVTANTAASAAQSAAVSQAASAAATVYGATKDLVSGWVATGKTTINGGKIETDTILAGAIKAFEITVKHLAAGAVTAQSVAAGAIQADHLQAGSVDTTKLTADAIYGKTIEAGTFRGGILDIVGSIKASPNKLDIYATSIDALGAIFRDNVSILGLKNYLKGKITLGNGITDPGVSPTVSPVWPYTSPLAGDFQSYNHGLCDSVAGTSWVVVSSIAGASGATLLDKSSGAAFPVATKPWMSGFSVDGGGFAADGGITRVGANYYVLGFTTNTVGARTWNVYKLDSNFNFVDSIVPNVSGSVKMAPTGTPAIGTDGTRVLVAWTQSGTTYLRRYDTNLSLAVSATYSGGPINFGAVYAGVESLGGGSSERVFFGAQGAGMQAWFATGARDSLRDVARAGGANVRGGWWDGTRWWSLDDAGRIWQYGRHGGGGDFAYAWHDNVGPSIATTRESPRAQMGAGDLPRGSWVKIDTPAPEYDGTVDGANTVIVYGSLTTDGTLGSLATYTQGQRSQTFDIITPTTGVQATNGFANRASSAPGSLTSSKVGAHGGGASSALTEIDGAGNARLMGTDSWQAANTATGVTATGFAPPEFRRNPTGDVYLRGAVTATIPAGTTGIPLFTLPVGYRPSATERWVQQGTGAGQQVRIQVDPAGVVTALQHAGTVPTSFYINLNFSTFTNP